MFEINQASRFIRPYLILIIIMNILSDRQIKGLITKLGTVGKLAKPKHMTH